MTKNVKFSRTGLVLLGALGVLSLTACGSKPVTAQSLAKSMVENLKKAESVEMNVTLDFLANLDLSSFSSELGESEIVMQIDMDIDATMDPEVAHGTGTTHLEMLGNTLEQETESYSVMEDGQTVTYSLADDQWYKSVAETGSEDMLDTLLYEGIADGSLEAELEEDFATVNDQDAYVLKTTLSGDLLQEFMETSVAASGTDSLQDLDVDWDDMKAKLKVYIYKDSNTLAQVKMDCKELGEAMMASSMGETGGVMDVRKYNLILLFKDYDCVDEIKVPDEVLNGAMEMENAGTMENLGGSVGLGDSTEPDSDTEDSSTSQHNLIAPNDNDDTATSDENESEMGRNADGSYTVSDSEGTHAATVTLLDGQEYSYSAEGYLASSNTDYSQGFVDVTYTFNEYTTLEEQAEDVVDCSWMDDYEGYSDIRPGTVKEMTVNGMKGYWAANSYNYDVTHFENYTGWVQVGEILFVVEVEIYGTEGEISADGEALLAEAFEHISVQ